MSKTAKIVLVAVVVIAIVGGIVWYMNKNKKKKLPASTEAPAAAPTENR